MNEERVFLNEGGTVVSISRIILSGITYATANITSVSKRKIPARPGCAIAVIAFGGFGLLMSFTEGFTELVASVVVLAVGILWYRSLKPSYLIVFASSSGESEAMKSTDEALIDRVVGAVNQAIISRG